MWLNAQHRQRCPLWFHHVSRAVADRLCNIVALSATDFVTSTTSFTAFLVDSVAVMFSSYFAASMPVYEQITRAQACVDHMRQKYTFPGDDSNSDECIMTGINNDFVNSSSFRRNMDFHLLKPTGGVAHMTIPSQKTLESQVPWRCWKRPAGPSIFPSAGCPMGCVKQRHRPICACAPSMRSKIIPALSNQAKAGILQKVSLAIQGYSHEQQDSLHAMLEPVLMPYAACCPKSACTWQNGPPMRRMTIAPRIWADTAAMAERMAHWAARQLAHHQPGRPGCLHLQRGRRRGAADVRHHGLV